MLLHTCAFGLNFRGVLNVLGEYPGDSRPPETDAAGVVAEFEAFTPLAVGDAAFGLGRAPLPCITYSITSLLAHKPAELSFKQACTLPVTWSTKHAALQRAGLLDRRTGHNGRHRAEGDRVHVFVGHNLR